MDMSKFVSRVAATEKGKAAAVKVQDNKLAKDCPALFEYLTLDAWEDGEVRQTATLLLFVEGGQFRGCVNDRENERSLWAGADTFLGLVGALEGRLIDPTADWRRSGQGSNGRAAKGRQKH